MKECKSKAGLELNCNDNVCEACHSDGFTSGYNIGHQDGFHDGYNNGRKAGYNNGFYDGYNEGSNRKLEHGDWGFSMGYERGVKRGFDAVRNETLRILDIENGGDE